MKKWSQIGVKKTVIQKDKQIKDILEEVLIVETHDIEIDDHIKIVGKDIAVQQIEEYYQQKFLTEQLYFLSEVRNNIITGHFEYLDNVIEQIEKQIKD